MLLLNKVDICAGCIMKIAKNAVSLLPVLLIMPTIIFQSVDAQHDDGIMKNTASTVLSSRQSKEQRNVASSSNPEGQDRAHLRHLKPKKSRKNSKSGSEDSLGEKLEKFFDTVGNEAEKAAKELGKIETEEVLGLFQQVQAVNIDVKQEMLHLREKMHHV